MSRGRSWFYPLREEETVGATTVSTVSSLTHVLILCEVKSKISMAESRKKHVETIQI